MSAIHRRFGALAANVPLDQIGRRFRRWIALRRVERAAAMAADQARLAHEARDALVSTAGPRSRTVRAVDPRHAIGAPARLVDRADLLGELLKVPRVALSRAEGLRLRQAQ